MASSLACVMAGSSHAGLVAHYEFNGDLTDSSGNGNTATLVDGSGGSSTNTGGKLTLIHATNSGSNTEYVDTGVTPSTTAGTIAFFYTNTGIGGNHYSYNSTYSNAANGDDWEMWSYSDGRVRSRIESGTQSELQTPTIPNAVIGQEYHYAFTWVDTAGTVTYKGYVDGVLITTDTGGQAPSVGALYIGGGNNNHGANGIYGDFRIYDNTLDDAAVAALAVPEPSSAALLGLGGLALILRRRKG